MAVCQTSKPSCPLHSNRSCHRTLSNPLSCPSLKRVFVETENNAIDDDDLWFRIREEAQSDIKQEPILFNYYCSSILSHVSLESALANHLAMKLSHPTLPSDTLSQLFITILGDDHGIQTAIRDDLRAARERDPSCISSGFGGFRCGHPSGGENWTGILIDHATGVVIGETAVVGDNVTILHNVTLGGTGKVSGDRHPKIGDGVLLGAGTIVLGNIRIGEEAKIGAGSVVLKEVPPRSTAVGNPARLINLVKNLVLQKKSSSSLSSKTGSGNRTMGLVIPADVIADGSEEDGEEKAGTLGDYRGNCLGKGRRRVRLKL
ncbi:hypothetical protein Patl1_09676 [Pistacia atlantica]|uniref:Uncharacterized protein n=1 Tax=Pistacia atlantica TaxID=434234 RepID=A0ACC1A745_9ROSI|nr:hypothetical protein Patl1_09676 [Pistacia atlantica]